MVASHILRQRGIDAPEGLVVLVLPVRQSAGLVAWMPFGIVAQHALVDPIGTVVPKEACDLRAYAAALRAADISSAAARVLEMTIAYAGERVQFEKPIDRQQAIQQ
jgi:acyl-CoA dehydrogenase